MAPELDFLLDPEYLVALGGLVPLAKTPLSPLAFGGRTALPPEQARNLHTSGVLDAQGRIAEGASLALSVLALTTAFARVQYQDRGTRFEHFTYYAPLDAAPVSLTSRPEGVEIRWPAPTEEVLLGLEQSLGASVRHFGALDAELPPVQALALAALLDLWRHAMLSRLVDGSASGVPPASVAAVHEAIETAQPENLQRVVNAVKGRITAPTTPEPDEVARALEALAVAGHAHKGPGGFTLDGEALTMAGSLLVVEGVLTVTLGTLRAEGDVVHSGFTCLQGGVRGLLYVESAGVNILMQTISGARLIDLLRTFLLDPDAVRSLGAAVKEEDDRTVILKAAPKTGKGMAALIPLDLVVVSEALSGRKFTLLKSGQAGRAPDNEVALEEPHVSRRHARFLQDDGGAWSVEDLGSANGTLVNEIKIEEPFKLSPGDTIRLSNVVLKVV